MYIEVSECPICKTGLNDYLYNTLDETFCIDCKLCGKYLITGEFKSSAILELKNKSKQIISAVIREQNELGFKNVKIGNYNFNEFLDNYLVPDMRNPIEKMQKLLLRTKERSKYFGHTVSYREDFDYSLAYAGNVDEFIALIKIMYEEGFIKYADSSTYTNIELTLKGWSIGTSLAETKTDSKQAFIAIWFDDSMDDSIKSIEDAVVENGYKPMCIRNEHFKEKIMDKAISEIKKSKFLIVDLTGDRNSVFFEAGLAHGLGLEAIYIYKKSDKEMSSSLEFYVKHYQCYEYINGEDLKIQLINIIGARIAD